VLSAERIAFAQQQVKVYEIFEARILSEDPNEQIHAVKMLNVLSPELAKNMATLIAEDSTQPHKVRLAAAIISESVQAVKTCRSMFGFGRKTCTWTYKRIEPSITEVHKLKSNGSS
jgi:hypothetical protein